MTDIPRGIRNNNPGNIDKGQPWQGLSADQSSDPRFCVFVDSEHGIRAIAKILISYHKEYGINSIRGAIDKWAPPVENDTTSYVNDVAAALGVDQDASVNMLDPNVLTTLAKAIIHHENGEQPYDDATVIAGVNLALA